MKWLDVEEFLSTSSVIIDVRSPIEFAKGHIPRAHNVPLFSDDERAEIGTLYKRKGKQEAIDLGLELVGPKMIHLVRSVRRIAKGSTEISLHCFRGGMRSQSMAWLLQQCGFHVSLLNGGYKAFRSWAIVQFSRSYPLIVLGGLTGSAKTEILHEIQRKGEAVLDLEGYANHKGSAFGALGCAQQPTQAQFENQLGVELFVHRRAKRIWIEDESRTIGRRAIPESFWSQIRSSTVLFLERTMSDRLDHLIVGYGDFSSEDLSLCAEKIRKRFGPDRTQVLLRLIEEDKLREAVELVLTYYDKGYMHGLSKRGQSLVQHISVQGGSHDEIAVELIEHIGN